MDDAFGLIIALVLLALLVGGIILPIVALVVSIRTRNQLNQSLSRLQSSSPLAPAESQSVWHIVQELTARVARLEAALGQRPPVAPAPETLRPEAQDRPEPIPSPPAAAAPSQIVQPAPPGQTPPPVQPPMFSAAAPARTINAQELESIIGRRWLGWAAVALILFGTA